MIFSTRCGSTAIGAAIITLVRMEVARGRMVMVPSTMRELDSTTRPPSAFVPEMERQPIEVTIIGSPSCMIASPTLSTRST